VFSARSRFDLTPNAFGRSLGRLREAGARLVDLTASNPTRCGLTHPGEEATRALADPRGLVYDPDPRGREEARRAIAAYYASHGATVDPDRVMLTASTSEAYAWLFKLLADDGEALLVPRPSYPLFDYLAGLEGVATLPYALSLELGFRYDADAVREAATQGPLVGATSPARPRAILLVSPNNPTGNAASASELVAMDRTAATLDLAVIADEVFADFAWDPRAGAPAFAAPRAREALTFSLSGLSKVCGLPQMKLAWIVLGGPEDRVREARAHLELIADTYLSVATPVQVALPELLAARAGFLDECRTRIRANLAAIDARLARTPSVRRLPGWGGWYACLRIPHTVPEEELVLALLEQDHVVVHPGYFFDFEREGTLVVSLITPPEELDEGLTRVLARVAGESPIRS